MRIRELYAWGVSQHLCGLLGSDLFSKLRVNHQRVAGEDGNTHAGARNQQIGSVQNLARLVAQLLLLVGFQGAVVDEIASNRHRVERDLRHVRAVVNVVDCVAVESQLGEVLLNGGLGLVLQGLHAGKTGTRGGLVGGNS